MSDSTTTLPRRSSDRPEVPRRAPETDAALVAALRSDDLAARGRLFDRYGGLVERILRRLLGSDAEVSDVLHEVFIAAFTSLSRLRNDTALRSWLTGIALHRARKLLRRRQRWRWIESVAPFDLPETAAPTPSVEVIQALTQAFRLIDGLPAHERIAFALRYIDGLELTAIAAVTHASLATTKRRIFRAQSRLVELSNKVRLR